MIYILNKTWTSSKIGPEDDHRRSKHVKAHGIPERTIYILNKTWTSSKIGPEDGHRRSKHVKTHGIPERNDIYFK